MYGVESLLRNDGFPNAQGTSSTYLHVYFTSLTAHPPALLNIIETLLNLVYLYLAHISPTPAAPLIGLASATMTLSKTVLYGLQDYYCGWCAIGHNDLATLIKFFIIPNGYVVAFHFWLWISARLFASPYLSLSVPTNFIQPGFGSSSRP